MTWLIKVADSKVLSTLFRGAGFYWYCPGAELRSLALVPRCVDGHINADLQCWKWLEPASFRAARSVHHGKKLGAKLFCFAAAKA